VAKGEAVMFPRRQTETLIKYFPHPYERVFEMLDRKIIDIPEARWLLGLEHDLQTYNEMRKYK
jgi:hypothetical protein